MKKIFTIILIGIVLFVSVFIIIYFKNKTDLGCNMYIDNKGVYEMVSEFAKAEPNKRVDRPELDAKTFEIIDNNYSIDKNHVYYMCNARKVLEGADPASFRVYKKGIRLSRDKQSVFYNDYKVEDSDPDTYQEIGPSFDKDKNNVYYVGKKIDGADPESFKPLKYGLGIDKTNIYDCYIKCDKIYEIDINSFVQVDDNSWKDKEYYYCFEIGVIHKSREPCND